MTNNDKYKKLVLIAAAVVAVAVIVLFFTGKLDWLLVDQTAGGSYYGDSTVVNSDTPASVTSDERGSSDEASQSSSTSSNSTPNVQSSSDSGSKSSTASSSSKVPNSSVSGSKSSSSSSGSIPNIHSSSASSASTAPQSQLRFRNKSLLNQHYEKHGKHMGFASAAEYEAAAAKVPFDPNVLHKIEAEDGDDVYYIESTNEFVVVSTDGYLRTYFNPARGIDYFNDQ